jgi:hypothetical protein
MTPGVQVLKQCYEKGKLAGKRAKVYDERSRNTALDRFVLRYPALPNESKSWWLDGWRDAVVYRNEVAL